MNCRQGWLLATILSITSITIGTIFTFSKYSYWVQRENDLIPISIAVQNYSFPLVPREDYCYNRLCLYIGKSMICNNHYYACYVPQLLVGFHLSVDNVTLSWWEIYSDNYATSEWTLEHVIANVQTVRPIGWSRISKWDPEDKEVVDGFKTQKEGYVTLIVILLCTDLCFVLLTLSICCCQKFCETKCCAPNAPNAHNAHNVGNTRRARKSDTNIEFSQPSQLV